MCKMRLEERGRGRGVNGFNCVQDYRFFFFKGTSSGAFCVLI